MSFPPVQYTTNEAAASGFVSNAAEKLLNLSGLNPIAQLQSAVANLLVSASGLTLAGTLTTVGAYGVTLTATATTSLTLPTTGTLATTAGNVATATALANARTIGGVSFNGTANITVASATAGFTVTGGKLSCAVSAAGYASFNLGNAGTAPTVPADGDMWIESNTIKVRLNGSTVTVTTS